MYIDGNNKNSNKISMKTNYVFLLLRVRFRVLNDAFAKCQALLGRILSGK